MKASSRGGGLSILVQLITAQRIGVLGTCWWKDIDLFIKTGLNFAKVFSTIASFFRGILAKCILIKSYYAHLQVRTFISGYYFNAKYSYCPVQQHLSKMLCFISCLFKTFYMHKKNNIKHWKKNQCKIYLVSFKLLCYATSLGNLGNLFCTCNIFCMSVHPGRGIPPLWVFLKFFFFFDLIWFDLIWFDLIWFDLINMTPANHYSSQKELKKIQHNTALKLHFFFLLAI